MEVLPGLSLNVASLIHSIFQISFFTIFPSGRIKRSGWCLAKTCGWDRARLLNVFSPTDVSMVLFGRRQCFFGDAVSLKLFPEMEASGSGRSHTKCLTDDSSTGSIEADKQGL